MHAVSLVTLTTLFTSVMDSLPRTAYLKLIDMWFVATLRHQKVSHVILQCSRFVMSLCIPAIEMLLHTIIAELPDDDANEVRLFGARGSKMVPHATEGRIRRASFWRFILRVILPIVYILVALAIILPGVINVLLNEYV